MFLRGKLNVSLQDLHRFRIFIKLLENLFRRAEKKAYFLCNYLTPVMGVKDRRVKAEQKPNPRKSDNL